MNTDKRMLWFNVAILYIATTIVLAYMALAAWLVQAAPSSFTAALAMMTLVAAPMCVTLVGVYRGWRAVRVEVRTRQGMQVLAKHLNDLAELMKKDAPEKEEETK